MVKFMGLECATHSLAGTILEQLTEDEYPSVCANCWFGFRTMSNSCERLGWSDKFIRKTRKIIEQYYKIIDGDFKFRQERLMKLQPKAKKLLEDFNSGKIFG